MKVMENHALAGNTRHFDNEIDLAGSAGKCAAHRLDQLAFTGTAERVLEPC